jgi:hypothetical protein
VAIASRLESTFASFVCIEPAYFCAQARRDDRHPDWLRTGFLGSRAVRRCVSSTLRRTSFRDASEARSSINRRATKLGAEGNNTQFLTALTGDTLIAPRQHILNYSLSRSLASTDDYHGPDTSLKLFRTEQLAGRAPSPLLTTTRSRMVTAVTSRSTRLVRKPTRCSTASIKYLVTCGPPHPFIRWPESARRVQATRTQLPNCR